MISHYAIAITYYAITPHFIDDYAIIIIERHY
jgi:hypothetical protein